jgi:ATP-dependent Clp protease ATP-binding subunit ClpA
MMIKCSICKKNIAVVFITKIINGKQIQQGLCISCAKKQGIKPINDILEQTGLSEEDLDKMNSDIMDKMMEGMDIEEMDELGESIGDFADISSRQNDEAPNPIMSLFNRFFPNPKSDQDDDKDNYDPDTRIEEDSRVQKDYGRPNRKNQRKNEKQKVKTKNLDSFATDLTAKARANQVDRVIGRTREINRAIQILNRRNKNNLCLIGEPGVGKTAIAEGLAVKIANGEVPPKMRNARIYQLDMTGIVAGTHFRGQFEARMKGILQEAKALGNVILVIDEIHNIMGAGDAEGAMNAANILKPALAKGEIQVIGATTLDEYRKHIEKDSALERRFQPILVEEPSVDEAIEIVMGIKDYYEDYHKVKIDREIVEAAVILSDRYITDRFLPDKAIDLIDEAGSKANLENPYIAREIELMEKIEEIEEENENNIIDGIVQDYEKAAKLRALRISLEEELKENRKKIVNYKLQVEDIAAVIEAWTNIPVQKITEVEAAKLLKLEENLHKRIISQEKAVGTVAKAIRRNRSGLKRKKRPTSFIFVGPTGVGKTELVKALTQELFGSEENMIRLDMSEFMEKHTVSKLIGSPPGYVGYDDGGQLTERIRRRPYSVVLMDEIEKAHPDVFNILLQIMEDGRLTDSHGRTVSFENTVLIMTSNAGTTLKSKGIGFTADQTESLENSVKEALKEIFRPEFLNRVDDVVIFTELSKDDIKRIAVLMLNDLSKDLAEKHVRLEYADDVIEFLAEKGYNRQYGARPLRRAVQTYLEDLLSDLYLRGKLKAYDTARLFVNDGNLDIHITQGREE